MEIQVAHRNDVPELDDIISYGNFVRFGKPTEDLYRNGVRSYQGWLDEFAIWNCPLSKEEVAQQYKSAIGDSSER